MIILNDNPDISSFSSSLPSSLDGGLRGVLPACIRTIVSIQSSPTPSAAPALAATDGAEQDKNAGEQDMLITSDGRKKRMIYK
jgi:hypothetical protein